MATISRYLIRDWKREGMELAAAIVEREADKLAREAERVHRRYMRDEASCEAYEEVEAQACSAGVYAARIRKAAKRLRS